MTTTVRSLLVSLCAVVVVAQSSVSRAEPAAPRVLHVAIENESASAVVKPPSRSLLLLQTEVPAAAPAAVQTAPPAPKSTYKDWWFWAALGVLVAGTATALILSSHEQSPPNSQLGDMGAAFRRPLP